MTVSRIRSRLRGLQRAGRMVQVTRRYPSHPRLSGFVVGVGDELVAIEQYHDFYNEGFFVSELQDLERVRAGARERMLQRAIEAERLRPSRPRLPACALTGWADLFTALSARGENVIVHAEQRTSVEEDFYIGAIQTVDDDSLVFRYFDPVGRWDAAPDRIAFVDVTAVEFATPYIRLMSKYAVGSECPPTARRRRASRSGS